MSDSKKRFGLTDFAVDNGVSMMLLMVMIFFFGWNSFRSMPKEQFPDIVIPTIFVATVYSGNSAEDMENLISKPLEKELASISGIKEMKSTSIQDFSTIIIEFSTDVEVEKALREVKDAVDKAKADKDFPKDLTSGPDVAEVNFADFPIMSINLAGKYSAAQLRKYAEDLQTEIEKLPEVSEVDIKGVSTKEIRVDVDLFAMQSRQVSFNDIANAIKMENLTMSAGERQVNGFKRSVRVVGEFTSAKEIENIIIKSPMQQSIFLRDIATVKEDLAEITSIARSEGLPVVSLDVKKRAGENLLGAAEKIKEILAQQQETRLPKDLKVTLFNDQSLNVESSVANLQNNILSGVVLVVLTLLFFLGLRNALFVGIAIPLSMLLAIAVLDIMGVSLNMIVLFALVLGLGMLVDNSIVVVENVYRYMTNGTDSTTAAKIGTGEIAIPVLTSTATTIGAFLPLIFWPGVMGQFMAFLPITLIIVMLSSLFVGVVITPVLTNYYMKVEDLTKETKNEAKRRYINNAIFAALVAVLMLGAYITGNKPLGNILLITLICIIANVLFLRPGTRIFQSKVLPALENAYEAFISWSLSGFKPIILFFSMFVLLWGSMQLIAIFTPKVIFFPAGQPTYVNVFVEMPIGTDIQETNKMVRLLEEKIDKAILPYKEQGVIDAVLAQVGENTGDPSRPAEPGTTPHKARITVAFVKSEDRINVSTYDIMDKIRESVTGIVGATIIVDRNSSGPATGKPFNLEIYGHDVEMATLAQTATNVLNYLKAQNIPGVEELTQDISTNLQQDLILIDREAARRYGLSTYDIAFALRTSLYGAEVATFKDGEDKIPIMVRYADNYRQDQGALLDQMITFRDMATGQTAQVPISTVAKVAPISTFSAVARTNEKRTITISSNVLLGFNPNEVVAAAQSIMKDYDLPEGFDFRFSGEQEDQAEAMNFLSTALGISVALVFFVMVLQFNNISAPILIITTIIFSIIGVLLGYVMSGMDLVIIMTGIGIISLAAVVVNNAIVLLDYIKVVQTDMITQRNNHYLSDDEVKATVIEAGKTRLRPVLLTAITTVLGLYPLAIGFNFDFTGLITDLNPNIYYGGDGAEMWGSLAWTVIFGLTFATFLTLIILPIMYWLVYRGNAMVRNGFRAIGQLLGAKQ